jgi:transposase
LDILDLYRSGLTQRDIARKLGISRNTVKKYIENPESCLKDQEPYQRESILDPYHGTIKAWLDEDEYYKATWIYDRLVNQGYAGSYETVKRKVGKLKSLVRIQLTQKPFKVYLGGSGFLFQPPIRYIQPSNQTLSNRPESSPGHQEYVARPQPGQVRKTFG